MEQLKVIGTEEGILVLATESGERFALPVNETLRAQLRTARPSDEPRAARPSPREIQAHIRAGMSAADVATLLGVRVEDVTRYERPIIAEREHIVGQALAVPVLIAGELEPDAQPTFGTAVRTKLSEAGATGERWTSWREADGWVVKLEFTVSEVEHDARWSFDPRRSSLSPLNSDATQLSRQGSLPEGLIPRLRALDTPQPKDDSRFDSGAFGPRHPALSDPETASPTNPRGAASAAQDAAIKRAPEPVVTSSETADLLEALRRRRGQREPMPSDERSDTRERTPVALFDALEPGYQEPEPAPEPEPQPEATDESAQPETRRRGRTSMPSWDEIVFGARSEDA
ncbi:septation protein SepH [Microbacterium thalli]|uniref:Septation protein SepH n=1 Tax=Microbacterium thalli TaxID=3027921 RepID=A0ABT5SIA0_9MICO|nr:septation protein SepH [Microbacterium thalli]MDD7962528.1 septation protein SepH [Microbacterium thalli]